MNRLQETVAQALFDAYDYKPNSKWQDNLAAAALTALGLDDLDAAIDRGAHAICDDPECVTTICNARARRVLEAVLMEQK